ncbi:MAG: YdcH family protein [Sulfurovum sp.]|nr:YdcH family protein [Sulfurovum sp.]
MLHEYRDEIHELKQENAHFAKIFEKHNELDDKITKAENGDIPMTDMEIETLKKEKLLLKDEAYKMILDYKKSKQA